MANRPGSLCSLQPGKAIGAQSNFASTFNWLVSAVSNLRGGKGIKVSWPADDTPEIATDGEQGGDGGGGGSAIDCVTDVARGESKIENDGSYTVTENLDVTYSTGEKKSVPLPSNNGVKDIEESDIYLGKQLTVKYENSRPEKDIKIPYKTEFSGTDNSYSDRGTEFSYSADSNSNVTVRCFGNVLKIGVYYT